MSGAPENSPSIDMMSQNRYKPKVKEKWEKHTNGCHKEGLTTGQGLPQGGRLRKRCFLGFKFK